ncbi:MAG TPA: hypothetical protein VG939_16125 [Caulobacteraceae bacterium]|nr:hypothetical protein [Caulobacteraceae bacterium]
MELKPGSRWKSAVCAGEVVVVRPPKSAVTLECGGHPMLAHTAERPAGVTAAADRTGALPTGKRYVDDDTGMEALVSKAGEHLLSVDGRLLKLKEAKALPSSD